MIDPASSHLQVIGGWVLFTDMVLTAVLFAFWEKAGRMRNQARPANRLEALVTALRGSNSRCAAPGGRSARSRW